MTQLAKIRVCRKKEDVNDVNFFRQLSFGHPHAFVCLFVCLFALSLFFYLPVEPSVSVDEALKASLLSMLKAPGEEGGQWGGMVGRGEGVVLLEVWHVPAQPQSSPKSKGTNVPCPDVPPY